MGWNRRMQQFALLIIGLLANWVSQSKLKNTHKGKPRSRGKPVYIQYMCEINFSCLICGRVFLLSDCSNTFRMTFSCNHSTNQTDHDILSINIDVYWNMSLIFHWRRSRDYRLTVLQLVDLHLGTSRIIYANLPSIKIWNFICYMDLCLSGRIATVNADFLIFCVTNFCSLLQ